MRYKLCYGKIDPCNETILKSKLLDIAELLHTLSIVVHLTPSLQQEALCSMFDSLGQRQICLQDPVWYGQDPGW